MDITPSFHDTLRSVFAGYQDAAEVERLLEELKVRGGQEQLIMFLSGPAGAGNSAAVKVARRFCFDFCCILVASKHTAENVAKGGGRVHATLN